jgi:hypothetical protein
LQGEICGEIAVLTAASRGVGLLAMKAIAIAAAIVTAFLVVWYLGEQGRLSPEFGSAFLMACVAGIGSTVYDYRKRKRQEHERVVAPTENFKHRPMG